MNRVPLLLSLFSFVVALQAQNITEFRELSFNNTIEPELTSTRSAVFIHLFPKEERSLLIDADWKEFSDKVHGFLYKMGIDAVVYVNQADFTSGNSTKKFYQDFLNRRKVRQIIFINQQESGYELICAQLTKDESLISNGQSAYRIVGSDLRETMLDFARAIKRADHPLSNFLIPERPLFLDGISIVEKLNLKNYPGQIRRNRLAVEKFSEINVPKNASDGLKNSINQYNESVAAKNLELEMIMKELPYDITFIDYMDDENLLRKRHQFVLRNLYASGESIRSFLKYEIKPANSGYVSVIPIMPDNTSIKTIPKNALVHKFYIRQNIAKNVYVGEWDADETWQDALRNYLRNMIQYFNKGN